MSFSDLLNILIALTPGIITYTVLYFTDKIFNYKIKVVNMIGSTRSYEIGITIFTFVLIIYSDVSIFPESFYFSVFFGYMYLIKTPKQLC